MCRILLVKSEEILDTRSVVSEFAEMCRKSRALDGDWQGDGWGITFLNEENKWQTYKSLRPVWDEYELKESFPKSKIFAVHARSASFPSQRGFICFNQPFGNEDLVFLSNLSLRGVKLKEPIPGKSGAEKLWFLTGKEFEKQEDLEKILRSVENLIETNCEEIKTMNIGLMTKDSITALCRFSTNNINPEYNNLFYFDNQRNGLKMISSEPFGDYDFKKIESGKILNF